MELASFLAGEKWGDELQCAHPVITALAHSINDQVSDQNRHLLTPWIPAVIGTTDDRDPLPWTGGSCRCGWRRGAPGRFFPSPPEPESAEAAVVAAEAWADCPCVTHAAGAAAASVEATARGDYSDAAVAATTAARIVGHVADLRFGGEAARRHETQATAPAKDEALSAATEAVHAAACAATGDAAKVALLTGLLFEHARLTGRVRPGPARPGPMSQADTDRLVAATGTPATPTATSGATAAAWDDGEVDSYPDWPGDLEDPQYRYCDHPLCECEPLAGADVAGGRLRRLRGRAVHLGRPRGWATTRRCRGEPRLRGVEQRRRSGLAITRRTAVPLVAARVRPVRKEPLTMSGAPEPEYVPSAPIPPQEGARRRKAVDAARHSSEMEGSRSDEPTRADQEVYVRGELSVDDLIERVRQRQDHDTGG